jgi:hypothetical protein
VRIVSPDSFTAQSEVQPDRTASTADEHGPTTEPVSASTGWHCMTCPQDFAIPGMPVAADIKVGKRTVLDLSWAWCCQLRTRGCASHDARGPSGPKKVVIGARAAMAVVDRLIGAAQRLCPVYQLSGQAAGAALLAMRRRPAFGCRHRGCARHLEARACRPASRKVPAG